MSQINQTAYSERHQWTHLGLFGLLDNNSIIYLCLCLSAVPQHSNVAVVTREWVLDSVACYQCQELSAYLMS